MCTNLKRPPPLREGPNKCYICFKLQFLPHLELIKVLVVFIQTCQILKFTASVIFLRFRVNSKVLLIVNDIVLILIQAMAQQYYQTEPSFNMVPELILYRSDPTLSLISFLVDAYVVEGILNMAISQQWYLSEYCNTVPIVMRYFISLAKNQLCVIYHQGLKGPQTFENSLFVTLDSKSRK